MTSWLLPALAFLLFMLLIAWWADTGSMPDIIKSLYAFPHGDLLGHFVLYGLLAYLLERAFPRRRLRIGRWKFPPGAVVAILGATLEEASQFFFVGRSPDGFDLLCGALGILAGSLLARLPVRRQPPPQDDAKDDDRHDDDPE